MATVRIPLWNQTLVWRNNVPFFDAAVSGSSSNGDVVYNQSALVDDSNEIDIVPNGGLLPADDDKIQVIASGFGVIPPASLDPDYGWLADRVSVPNKIILQAGVPVDPFYINIQFAIAAIP